MTLLMDLGIGLWVVAIAWATFVLIPATALGRSRGSTGWSAEALAGAAWATLTSILLVPALARFHLFTWATALLVPLAWPIALWIYRYRGAPAGEFRELCRSVVLSALAAKVRRPRADTVAMPAIPVLLGVAAVGAIFWPALAELRLQSPGDYETLAATRLLLDGGSWVMDPAACIAAVLAKLSAVDAMQAVRFLRPLTLVACTASLGVFVFRLAGDRVVTMSAVLPVAIVPAFVALPPTAALLAFLFIILTATLVTFTVMRTHARDWRHVAAAAVVALWAWTPVDAHEAAWSGHLEYDAAARVTLDITRRFAGRDWTIVGPPIQRLKLPLKQYVSQADFVRRYDRRAGDRTFRFDTPGRHVFVFVEKNPLIVEPPQRIREEALPVAYQLPNMRVRLERAALDVCERYRRSHAAARVYYDDDNLRVYHFEK